MYCDILPDALTLMIFASSFKLSPSSFVPVTTNSYTLPLSNFTCNSLTDVSVIVSNFFHSPGLSSVTILWYTLYSVISFPLFCGSLHFRVIVSSVTSLGRPSIVAAAGTPRLNKISWYERFLKPQSFQTPNNSKQSRFPFLSQTLHFKVIPRYCIVYPNCVEFSA